MKNPDLQWETTATTNVGLDFTLFKGKLSGSFDWYNKLTDNLIYNYPVDPNVYPVGNIIANVGKLRNRGIEVTLNSTPVSTGNFSWTTGLNVAHNVNKIVTLSNDKFSITKDILQVQPDGGGQTGSTVQLIRPGTAIGTFYTFKYAGKNAAGVSQYYNAAGNLVTNPANITDYFIAGNAQPKALIGWSNSFTYKNFDLNIFMRAVLGNKIMNVTRADLFRPSTAQFTNIPVESK